MELATHAQSNKINQHQGGAGHHRIQGEASLRQKRKHQQADRQQKSRDQHPHVVGAQVGRAERGFLHQQQDQQRKQHAGGTKAPGQQHSSAKHDIKPELHPQVGGGGQGKKAQRQGRRKQQEASRQQSQHRHSAGRV